MRHVSAALMGVIILLVCTTSALLVRIWVLRRSFDMAARSPILLICVGLTVLVMLVLVLLHWFLLLEGQGLGLPCFATFVASYFCEYVLRTTYTTMT